MKIFEANSQHAKVIIQKIAALIKELGGKAFFYNEAEVLGFIEVSMANGKYIAYLAVDDSGKVVGVITLGESGAVYAGGKFGVIHELYIDPDMRSCGIGRLLIEKAKQKSLSLKWSRLEVGAPAYFEWRRTTAFYLREGFQEVGPRLKWPAGQCASAAEDLCR